METSMHNPSFYFVFFYLLSFVILFVVVIVFSLKRKYHLRSVLLLLTTISLFTIIGSRLFTIPITEWGNIFSYGFIADYNDRSAIGGLLFGFFGLILAQKFIGFQRPMLDLYAWIAPMGLGIQKMGCFINGCCYGKPTDLFLGIQYPEGSHAHFNHWTSSLIDESSMFSLNVHPVQLYEMGFLLLISFTVWRTHRIWNKNGSALLFGLFLFFIFRFGIEFIRDPASSQFNSQYILGVRLFQWVLLVIGLASGLLLIFYEKYLKFDVLESRHNYPKLRTVISFVFIIATVIYLFQGIFSTFEIVALGLMFIPSILLTGIHVYMDSTIKKYRLATSFLLIFPIYMMAQSYQTDSNKEESYERIDFGTSIGSLYNELEYNPHEGECGTTYTREQYKIEYRVAGAGYSKVKKSGKSITTYGVNVYGGTSKEINLTQNIENSYFIGAVNPQIKYDMKWVGIGAGAHIGNLRWIPNKPIEKRTFEDGTKSSWIMPEVYFRLGRRDILDIQYNYGFNFPSPYPALTSDLSIGSGFGQKTDYSLRYGISFPLESEFISAEALITKQFGMRLIYIYGGSDEYFSGENKKASARVVIGMNYRFGFKN